MSKKYPGGFVTNLGTFGNSVFFDGTGDYLSVPTGTALSLTGDYTIEAWVYVTAQPSASFSAIFSNGDFPATAQVILALNTSGAGVAPNLYVSNGSGWSINLVGSQQINLNTWTHVAVTCSGSTFTLWTNGVSSGTATYSGTRATPAATSVIGRLYVSSDLYYVTGNISNLRVVKGTALYTSAFPPPNQLLNVPNTSLLTCNSPLIVDQSSSALAITVNGNTAVSTFTPFPVFNPAPTSFSPLTPAPGVWTLDQALQYTQQGVWPSYAVNAIEDVFSTYLYTGNGSTQTITNSIDLSGKGGLVWIKCRTTAFQHNLIDTVRGPTNRLSSNSTGASSNDGGAPSFNSNGFTVVANSAGYNNSGDTFASWTFRKQPKFFDIVTWTGTGATGAISHSHSLGSEPGCIIIKAVSTNEGHWYVYHRSLGVAQVIALNLTNASSSAASPDAWTVSSTQFSVHTSQIGGNTNGTTYVAYLFAHDAGGFGLTGTDNVISCVSFTTDGSGNATVSLGYEPQWLMVKASSAVQSWYIEDNMRAFNLTSRAILFPNLSNAEATGASAYLAPNSTGFAAVNGQLNASTTYIYIAIRRGPMKVPTTGTSVFYPQTIAQAESKDSTNVPFPPDLVNTFSRNGTDRTSTYNLFQFVDRLRGFGNAPNNTFSGNGGPALISSSTAAEVSTSYVQLKADSQNITSGSGWNSASYGNWIYYFMRRAPSFFDEVCYTGDGTTPQNITHNLSVAPEMMIIKCRSNASTSWVCYHKGVNGGVNPQNYYMLLQSDQAQTALTTMFNDTAPTSSVFTVGAQGSVGLSGRTQVAYLFATCAGVSKVGSYTGTATTKQIDCGFTAGARFVLIKRTDSTGDWYVWDTARGIVAGNDSYLLLNSTAAEVTSTDYIDTYSAGFEISSTAPAAINANGGSFIFFAVA
jgi:hypothetical protein